MATWREKISEELEKRGEAWADIESIAPEGFDLEADADGYEPPAFRLWTKAHVYFSHDYDLCFYTVVSIPRAPSFEEFDHVS